MIQNITGKDARQYTHIFFDFDGTLADSGQGCVAAARYMFSCLGIEKNDDSELLKFVGPPVVYHLQNAYGFSEQRAQEAYKYFREYYKDNGIRQIALYDGITDLLTALKRAGKTLFLATSKTEKMARELSVRFALTPFFEDIFGAWHERGISTKTQVLEQAAKRLGGMPPRAVMVGDRCYDIEGARHVGLDAIGVLYGYGGHDELSRAGCDFLVDTVAELIDLLGGRL